MRNSIGSLGKGDKATISGNPIDLGLSSREAHNHSTKLRSETSEGTQRPVGTMNSVSSDRGTFKSRD